MTGIGEEDIVGEHQAPPDFERGSSGAPLVTMPDGSREQYARPSGFGDTLDDKSALTNWRIDRAIEGVSKRPELAAAIIAADGGHHTKLREEAIQAGRGAYRADLGTAIHAMSERWEQDLNYDPGEPYRSLLGAYDDARNALGLESTHFECQFVNDHFRAAGTADRIYRTTKELFTPDGVVLPAGTNLIGDLKTGKSLQYSIAGYAVQMFLYASGKLYDVEANVRLATPKIDQRWGVIAHLSPEEGFCEMLWVDLDVGAEGATLASHVKEWRRQWRRKDGFKTTSGVPIEVAE